MLILTARSLPERLTHPPAPYDPQRPSKGRWWNGWTLPRRRQPTYKSIPLRERLQHFLARRAHSNALLQEPKFPDEAHVRRSDGLTQSRTSRGPPVVTVAAGCKFTRLAPADVPEYKTVNDTRRLDPAVSHDTAESNLLTDNDSLPDVHW
ncbi:hypothetical protein K503DRAFT_803473 [Rhizopogon vinicolor AM-OR11-026]|uniref:Uncharacterized protein n=1 Tax=Rhizopogon vinicolor AM-OR11-026 TaxID=1314800 RepID=A0A1B7MPP8_9AGAM|nr:hypothetical protein K503DRAFT_803473 [Rhizopogon vinicolor AM-OR11-026]